mmetsp:Transcript_12439/g.33290  ORF Transcript_12439/g.33290 Transcript_12439/m.33290 type:complete len:234 (-) Transcript_12439:242-943(-)
MKGDIAIEMSEAGATTSAPPHPSQPQPLSTSAFRSIILSLLLASLLFLALITTASFSDRTSPVQAQLATLDSTASAIANTARCQPYADAFGRVCTSSPNASSSCYAVISRVEDTAQLQNMSAVFSSLNAIEPQSGPINVWAVDEGKEDEPSHRGYAVAGIANVFGNPAYHQAARAHKESTQCGGFSLTYWKPFSGEKHLQFVYCQKYQKGEVVQGGPIGPLRICAAFNYITSV